MPLRSPTRATFHAFLEANGLAHLARLNLESLAPFLDPAHWSRLRTVGARRRLSSVASDEDVTRSSDWLEPSPFRDAVLAAVPRLVEHELDSARLAATELATRLASPADARLVALHARLVELRSHIPSSVSPRPARALSAETLSFDAALPGFRFHDELPSEHLLSSGGGFHRAKVQLALAEGRTSATCSCGVDACVHVLAAIDTALLMLPSLSQRELEALSRPAWQRTLESLQRAFTQTPSTTPARLEFQLEVDGEHVFVTGCLDGEAVPRDVLLGRVKEPAQIPLVALLPDEGVPAPRALLEGLVGHPHLVLSAAPQQPVRIERVPVGVGAEDRAGVVRLVPSLEGAPMPPAVAERVRRAKPDALLFLWDPGPRVLTLLDVQPELRAMLEVLHREGASFPPASHAALLESLTTWSTRMSVSMPRSVMGERALAEVALVLRLEAQRNGSVELEVRVRPLPDAPAMFPGLGQKDVYLRRDEKAVHAVRDLAAEREAAEMLVRELGVGDSLPRSQWVFALETPDSIFGLLERAGRHRIRPQLEWVGQPLRNLGLAGPRALQLQLEAREDWFGGLGGLSVFGERVELARLVEAVRRESRFVQVTSHGFVELHEVLRAHLEAAAAHVSLQKGAMRFGPAAVESLRNLERVGARVEGDSAWKKRVTLVEAANALEPTLPEGFTARLRPYQLEAFRWLSRLAAWGAGAVLADDMGLGKTVQSLAVLVDRSTLGPALVVAPTSVTSNWRDEARRFASGLNVLVYSEASKRELLLDQLKSGDVLVVSYGLLVRDARRLAGVHFATAVFDEAQQLKNSRSQRFLAAKTLNADFRFALSGTPLENHLGELWTLFALVFPRLLGPWEAFRAQHALPIEKNFDPRAPAALVKVIRPFFLRRTKSEVEAELPARTEVLVRVTLSPLEWQLYEDTRLAALSDLESPSKKLKEEQRRVQVLALLTRLRLAASHPRLLDAASKLPSTKLDRFMELVDRLHASGQRLLVFSQFTSHLALAAEALRARGLRFLSLDGSTPARQRAELVETFQQGEVPVFLISMKAGGVGLTLTAATSVIHLDPWWNPAVEDQASDRAHRIGQKRPVTIYRLISDGTVEEKMLSLHGRKRALIAKVLDGHRVSAKVSSDEMLELLK